MNTIKRLCTNKAAAGLLGLAALATSCTSSDIDETAEAEVAIAGIIADVAEACETADLEALERLSSDALTEQLASNAEIFDSNVDTIEVRNQIIQPTVELTTATVRLDVTIDGEVIAEERMWTFVAESDTWLLDSDPNCLFS